MWGQHSAGSGYPETAEPPSLEVFQPQQDKAMAALRLPKAPFSQHFYAFTGLVWFLFRALSPTLPQTGNLRVHLAFIFFYIWATANVNTSFLRWSRQNILWFKALCKEGFRHKSKDACKKKSKSKQFGKKKSKQTSNQMHLLRRTCRKFLLKYTKEKLLKAKVSGFETTDMLLSIRRMEKEGPFIKCTHFTWRDVYFFL